MSESKIQDVLNLFLQGIPDGERYKDFIIDQTVRILCGTQKAYEEFVREYEGWDEANNCVKYIHGTLA